MKKLVMVKNGEERLISVVGDDVMMSTALYNAIYTGLYFYMDEVGDVYENTVVATNGVGLVHKIVNHSKEGALFKFSHNVTRHDLIRWIMRHPKDQRGIMNYLKLNKEGLIETVHNLYTPDGVPI